MPVKIICRQSNFDSDNKENYAHFDRNGYSTNEGPKEKSKATGMDDDEDRVLSDLTLSSFISSSRTSFSPEAAKPSGKMSLMQLPQTKTILITIKTKESQIPDESTPIIDESQRTTTVLQSSSRNHLNATPQSISKYSTPSKKRMAST